MVKYHMLVDGKGQFVPLGEAARIHTSMWSDVRIGEIVLLEDGTTRPISDDERRQIVNLSDEIDGSK